MRLNILIVEDVFLEANSLHIILEEAGHHVQGIAKSVEQAEKALVGFLPDIVLVDIFLKGEQTGIDLAHILEKRNIPFIYLSANANASILKSAVASKPSGFLVKPFRERELLLALDIAVYRHQKNIELTSRQRQWLTSLLGSSLTGEGARTDKVLSLIRALTSFLPFDFIALDTGLGDSNGKVIFRYERTGFNDYVLHEREEELTGNNEEKEAGPYYVNSRKIAAESRRGVTENKENVYSAKLWLPVLSGNSSNMSITFYSRTSDCYTGEHIELMLSVQDVLARAMDNIRKKWAPGDRAVREAAATAPNQLLRPELLGIIGSSPLLLDALDKISQVAPFDSTVLITGETGVGKEGLVKAIHQLSPRRNKPLIKVNCAAIPLNLVESELFGHEKGAFTGALDRRIGKFELADGGTLFLDEVGELPLEIQTKLLRAIQEKEIERLGGRVMIKTNVRIVAATNRNLLKEIAEGRFRLDLYYRLHVFPITLPPLRERVEDIPALVQHFINIYCTQLRRNGMQVSATAMHALQRYHWPGNIRELQHLIERHILQTRGNIIDRFDMPEAFPFANTVMVSNEEIKPFREMDKDHILLALKKSNGKVSGRGGAAELLKLPPTTLYSKIKRMGITWPPQI